MSDMTETRTGPVGRLADQGRRAAEQGQETLRRGQETAREGVGTATRGAGTAAAGVTDGLGDQLKSGLKKLGVVAAERALSSVTGKVEGVTGRLTDFAEGGGGNLLGAITGSDKSIGGSTLAGAAKGALKGVFGKLGKGKGGKKLKLTNIIEVVDIGAPVRVVYNQWTQFQDFPTFMKKVEKVEQQEDAKLSWKAQVFWSHRTWNSTIREQVPDERIIWRSEGPKGFVDGAVSFHELTPDLTRVMVVLEYHPQGFMERTGNLWRAQGRRARLELKHFARHVMSQVMLHPDDIAEGGWRGEIRDGQVVKDHETAVAEEREREEGGEEGREPSAEYGEEQPEAEYGEEEQPEAEYEEGEEEPEAAYEEEEEEPEEGEEQPEAEYEEEEQPEAEYEEEEEEPEEQPRARRVTAATPQSQRARGAQGGRPVRRRHAEGQEEAPARRGTPARGR